MPLDPEVPFFSILMPARNEERSIHRTCAKIVKRFGREGIQDYEILIVNDHSTDRTERVLKSMAPRYPRVRYLNNPLGNGFGLAIQAGLEAFRGESVAIVMADLSDSPEDILTYYRLLKAGHDCVFGSRFVKGAKVMDYPLPKLILNRLANAFIQLLFGLDHNDITNAFKGYQRHVIEGVKPVLSHHFNITVELPLKAVVRGFEPVKVPISWTNRAKGISKFLIKEMGSRYLFIIAYVFLEKLLSRGDYRRQRIPARDAPERVSPFPR